MAESAATRPVWRRRLLLLAAAMVVLAIVFALVIRSASLRRYALQRAAAIVERDFGVRLQADDLDYRLFGLQVSVTGVRVASVRTPDVPFFTARRVVTTIPTSAIFGQLTIDSVAIDGGRVHIVRSADGRTNLPETRGSPDDEPAAIRIQYLNVTGLGVDIDDRVNDVALALPALDARVGPQSGRLELRKPGRIARGSVSTTIQALRGGIAFDGRTVRLENMVVRTDEGAATVGGDVHGIVKQPSVSLRVSGRGDVKRLARWGDVTDVPTGAVDFEADVKGPFAALEANAKVRSAKLAWRDLVATDVAAAAAVTPDTLRVRQLDARLAGGRLSATGEVPFGPGDTQLEAKWADVNLEALVPPFRLKAEATSGRRAEATPTFLSGRASGDLMAHGPRFDLDRWVIEASTRTTGATTTNRKVGLEGTLHLHVDRGRWQLSAEEAVAGVPMRATLNGRANFDNLQRSTVAGTVELPHTPIGQVLDALQRTDLATVRMEDTDGTVRGGVELSGTFSRPLLRVRGDATLADVGALVPDTPIDGSATVYFEGAGPPDALRGKAQITVLDTRYQDIDLGTLDSTVDLDAAAARIEAALREFNASATAAVSLNAPYDATIDLRVADADLSRLLRDVQTPLPVTGAVSLTAHGTGPLEDWKRGQVSVEVSKVEARAGDLPVRLTGPGRLSLANRVVNVASLEVAAGETHVSVSGALPLSADAPAVASADQLRATGTGDLDQIAKAVAATGMVTMPEVTGSGPVALLARVGGSIERPVVFADLELGPGSIRVRDLPPITSVHLRAHMDEQWIELRDATGEWQGSKFAAAGRAPAAWARTPRPSGGPPGTLTARATSITPAVLAPFLEADTLSQLEGSIDASLQLESMAPELSAARGEVRLDRLDLRIAELPVAQRVPTRIAIEGGFARVAAWEWTGQGANVSVAGRVNLTDRQAAILANGRFDLRMLTPFVRDAGVATAGTFEPRLSITGALDNPRIDGDVAIAGGEVRLLDPRVVASDVNARAVVTRTTAQITSLTGSVNGGTLSGEGQVAFAPGAPIDANLRVDVRGMALEFPEGLRSELNADLGLDLTVPLADPGLPSGALTGTVTVVRSSYREPVAVATALLAALRERRLAAQAAPEPSLADRLALDVRVLTDDDVVVDNNLGRLALGADLRVIGTAAAPALAGRAEVREGGQMFLGRNIYTLPQPGTIDFANPVTIEPDLSIVAETRVGGVEIQLTCTGTPDALACDPDAPNEAEPISDTDLYSLLLTGRRLDQVTGDEADIIGEQALAYLSGDVLGIASRAVGFDTIRLGGVDQATLGRDPTAVATEVDPTSRLTFGKAIGRNLDVTFSQSLRDSAAQTWIVDYRPRRQVELRLVSHDDDLRSYEFRHDVSFGGVSLASAPRRASARQEARVGAVRISGTLPVPEETLRAVLRLEQGDRFDFSEWQRDRDRLERALHAAGYYEARIAARRSTTDPIEVTYEIVPGPRTTIEVTGFELGEPILDRIRDAWAQSVFDEFLVEEVRDIVRAALAADGYLQPKVEALWLPGRPEGRPLPENASGGREVGADLQVGPSKTLAIRIDAGPRAVERRVRFEGADPALAQALEGWLRERGLERLAFEDPGAFERELTTWLRARGHLSAKVTVGGTELKLGATTGGATTTGEATTGEAVVPVTVDAGPVFTVADVRVDGAKGVLPDTLRDTVSPDTLRDTAALTSGSPYDPAALDAARDRLRAFLRRDGFATARVETRVEVEEPTRQVAVILVVEEGPRQVIREVVVEGNRAIDTDVITRALDLPLDEPVGAAAWLQARKRLFATGLFRRVDVAAETVGEPAPDAGIQPMRARVTVQEWPALRVRYGFQIAEERPEGEVDGRDLVPGLSADAVRRTVFGRAVTLGAGLQYQRRERQARGFINSRTLFGWPIESSLSVKRSREEFTSATLITDLSGVSWEQRFHLISNLRLSYSYSFERNHTFDTEPDPNSPVPPFDLTLNIARLNAVAAFDTRDDPSDTSRGLLVSSNFEYAPEVLGSEFRFAKYLAQGYYFRRWRGMVLASAARFGVAHPLGGQELLLAERFFAGGSRTVRGAAEDDLGPRDFFGDAAGGDALLVLNQEVRFPVYKWFRGVGFVDAGNVFERPSRIDPGDLVGSMGLGLRLVTPFALLRVDYGRLFSPRPNQKPGRWVFGIGQAF